MIWKMFSMNYELRSPLHIGYHKVGNVQRTRYYVPARNLWGAVTESLTRSGFSPKDVSQGDYEKIGEWVGSHLSFGYFFLDEAEELLVPHYGPKGLKMGDHPLHDFERRYLDSHVTTALDASTTSAENASLHEVEFIAPYWLRQDEAHRTKLSGRVFLDEAGIEQLGDEGKWRNWLDELQIGGERRYGFGQLRLKKFEEENDHTWDLSKTRPCCQINENEPLLAHTLADGIKARGLIEPLVGRSTYRESQNFGMHLTSGQACWVPGSELLENAPIEINRQGYWTLASTPG